MASNHPDNHDPRLDPAEQLDHAYRAALPYCRDMVRRAIDDESGAETVFLFPAESLHETHVSRERVLEHLLSCVDAGRLLAYTSICVVRLSSIRSSADEAALLAGVFSLVTPLIEDAIEQTADYYATRYAEGSL